MAAQKSDIINPLERASAGRTETSEVPPTLYLHARNLHARKSKKILETAHNLQNLSNISICLYRYPSC